MKILTNGWSFRQFLRSSVSLVMAMLLLLDIFDFVWGLIGAGGAGWNVIGSALRIRNNLLQN